MQKPQCSSNQSCLRSTAAKRLRTRRHTNLKKKKHEERVRNAWKKQQQRNQRTHRAGDKHRRAGTEGMTPDEVHSQTM